MTGSGTTLPRPDLAPRMQVFGSSGTRGVANETLTPQFVVRVAMAAGTTWGVDRVALGRDTRTTGPMFADAAASGLASVGADVDRLGVVPTPALQAHAEAQGVPGLMVTASHNPAPYNGIKLVGDDGVELAVSAMERVEETFLAERFEPVPWNTVGSSHRVDGTIDRYREGVRSSVDRRAISAADLTVAVDPGHGAGALTNPDLFRELGCRVVTVHAEPDGRFPGRDPEPIEANLADLQSLVRAADADVGVAHDGDADRAIFVDETGAYVEGDAALAALAADCLGENDVTVSAVNVSQRLVDVADAAGARLELTPIGSTRIVTRIRECLADGDSVPVAGEGNGGIIFPGYRLARDGAYTAARFLELCAERPASEVVAPHAEYHNVRYNLEYDTEAERTALVEAAAEHARTSEAERTTIDGYRLDYGDAWVLARPSGTEPLVRIYAEAREPDRAQGLADEVRGLLEDAIADV
jgi:phosphomannomutase/phosphoglucomutase